MSKLRFKYYHAQQTLSAAVLIDGSWRLKYRVENVVPERVIPGMKRLCDMDRTHLYVRANAHRAGRHQ